MFMGRGLLIDVAAYKAGKILPDGYAITVEDLDALTESRSAAG